jgi:predicted 2-oxoglutarate/Fe(II)-dependent dioxygenase YbiX
VIDTTLSPLKDFIKVYDFDLERESAVIRALDGWSPHVWYNSRTKDSHSEATKELEIRGLNDLPDIFHSLMTRVAESAKAYADEVMKHAAITSISPVRLNRYPAGSMMRVHSDHIHTLFDGQAKGIPAISLVGVLNDDYEGGDLIICGQPYRLKPGQIIVWPSCFLYPHEVTEITEGTRYSFVSWAW